MCEHSRLILFLISIATLSSGADHELYKNCSRRDFCNTLRDYTATKNYEIEIGSIPNITDNILYLPLKNEDENFILQVSLLSDSTARIKILEESSSRYQLDLVLDKEPFRVKIHTVNVDDNTLKVAPVETIRKHSLVITKGPPFKLEFQLNNETKVAFGDRFLLRDAKQSEAFAFEVTFEDALQLYGLHHHPCDLELGATGNGRDPFRLRNSDTGLYEVDSPMAVYGAVPAIYGHSKSSTSGIFLHNAAEQWIDIKYGDKPSAYFMVESAALDLFVILGPSPKEIVRQFTILTGVAHLPQLWTLGYHQCRFSYETQDLVKKVADNMTSHDFPVDAIWLDIDYTEGKKYFTWNPTNFSEPDELQDYLEKKNVKLVTILDPHIKVDDDYEVYNGAKGKYFVKFANGSDFIGDCWPGPSSYLDFLNPEARDYYASWYSYEKFKNSNGVAGVWNDMNEPSVFNNPQDENTLPFDALHEGKIKHGDVHNIYGFLQTIATHEGLMQRDNNSTRPFILTRSHFAGSQRYAAMWTGDNTADWPYLKISYSECLLSNLMGHVFCGADIGGLFGEPSHELAQRWWQAGIWLPFYRGHSNKNTARREPFLYPEDAQEVIRNAIKLRYKHIPVWYTLFFEHTRTGDPLIRPLFYNYPGTVSKNDHLLLGDDILARPVMEEGATEVEVYFPEDRHTLWYRIDDDSWTAYKGDSTETFPVNITTSPFFYRGGSIIVRKDSEQQNTAQALKDSFTLYVNLDANNNAKGRIYVDDYVSFEYYNNQAYFYAQLSYIPKSHGIEVSIINGNPEGFEVFVDNIVINQNSGKHKRAILTKTRDGTLLEKIDLVKALNKNKKFIIPL